MQKILPPLKRNTFVRTVELLLRSQFLDLELLYDLTQFQLSIFLNLGETGLGKSTLMDSLFNTAFESTPTHHQENNVKLKAHTYELEESNVKLKVRLFISIVASFLRGLGR